MTEAGITRFAELLKPIKDGDKNMEVDIASILGEYLKELAENDIRLDETGIDFSEAAMLVQSSACVYSKKVEYLFSLLLDMRNTLASRKTKAASEGTTPGRSRTQDFEWDSDDRLPNLDDIETCNCFLKEDYSVEKTFEFLKQDAPSLPKPRLHSGAALLLSEGEEYLASLDDFRCHTSIRASVKKNEGGEDLASLDDFRCHTSMLYGPNNLLLLDSSLMTLADLIIPPHATTQTQGTNPHTEQQGNVDDPMEADNGIPPLEVSMGDNHADDDMPALEVSMEQAGAEVNEVENLLETARARRSDRQRQVATATAKQKIDPWEPLDQYEETFKPKPHKKKAVHKLPPGLEPEKTRKRKRSKVVPTLEPLNQYIERAFFSNERKYPKNKLKCPTSLAFDRLFYKEYKRRQAIDQQRRAKLRKEQASIVDSEDREEEDEIVDDFRAADMLPDVEDDYEAPDHEDLVQAVDEGLRANEQFLRSLHRSDGTDSEESYVSGDNYEDLVRKHVELYFKSVEKFADAMDLNRRVDEWQSRIYPSLREEEEREPFDIKVYDKRVIGGLARGERVPFERVVAGKPGYEVCRTFLTMLMLANTENVKIHNSPDKDRPDHFSIQLLSTKTHAEELEAFLAPSEKT